MSKRKTIARAVGRECPYCTIIGNNGKIKRVLLEFDSIVYTEYVGRKRRALWICPKCFWFKYLP